MHTLSYNVADTDSLGVPDNPSYETYLFPSVASPSWLLANYNSGLRWTAKITTVHGGYLQEMALNKLKAWRVITEEARVSGFGRFGGEVLKVLGLDHLTALCT